MHLNSSIKFSLAMLCALPATFSLQAQDATPKTYDPYSANIPINYIRTWDALTPVTDPNQLVTKPRKEAVQTTSYVDGLGRPWQTVVKQGAQNLNGTLSDVVNTIVYDEYGREVRKYLPFVSTGNKGVLKFDPFQQQAAFYNSNNQNGPLYNQNETFYYGKTEFEASPLNRVERTYAPGNSWVNQGNGVKVQYLMNTINDVVRIWNVNDVVNGFGSYTASAEYKPGELYKTITIDEQDHQVIEFKDKSGLVILKKVQVNTVTDNGSGSNHENWLCTYYIYDDYKLLRAVIQPKGVEYLRQNGWDLAVNSNVLLNEQCFRYEYDYRDRMIMKKVPGAGAVNMVYDNRDRLVMTQDAVMADVLKKQWIYTQYDELNRPIATYLITDPTYYNNAPWHRTEFKNNTHPALSSYASILLTETHYDNYDGIPAGLTSTLNASGYSNYLNAGPDEYPDPVAATSLVNGLVTWTRTKVLTENKYITSCNLYDEKKRVIQVQSRNYTDGVDVITNQYSFSGQLLRSHIKHIKGGNNPQTYDAATKNTYDDLSRLTSVEKNINNGGWKEIAAMTYDALGQLKTKVLSPDYNSSGLETLTFDYNIRGWLLGANRDYAKSTTNTSHYFGFDLGYDKQTVSSLGSYAGAQYNGNITGTVWKSKGDNQIRKYDFTYDPVNRLTGADFNQYSSAFDKSAGVDFSVSNLTYDQNGNILSQTQKGLKGNTSDFIDRLTYKYKDNDYSNRLQNVIDASNDPQTKLGDFKYAGTKTSGATDYDYDVNGNLNLDNNKDIESITYNHLNLPQEITIKNNKGSIKYVYDAAGVKLEKVVKETGKPEKHTLYLFGIYEDDVLQFLPMEEGRIRPVRDANNAIASFTYDYFVKDHLGNVRMVLTEENKLDAYPAATLEGDLATSTDAVFIEKNYYDIKSACIVSKSEATGWTANVPNNNGNPPYNNNPNSNTTANSEKIYKLNADNNKTGLGITLQVMAGDKISIYGKSYWFNNSGNYNQKFPLPVSAILDAFAGNPAIIGKGLNTSGISTPTLLGDLQTFSTRTDTVNAPWAYINWIFFDEQFKYVGGGFDRVKNGGGEKSHALIDLPSLTAPKNGYVFVYCSNESSQNVYFDNLQVFHNRGPILEETHYYPFGLTMAGISCKGFNLGISENKKEMFNGAELNTEFDINMYEFQFRLYDPQIGRWHGIDTKPTDMVSPYAAMADNPIRYADPLGDTIALFKPDGSFWKFKDDGKKEWSGMYYQKAEIKSTYEKDGVTYEVRSYSEGKAFEFNDPAVDVQAIKNGAINRVEIMSDAKVEERIDASGVKGQDAQSRPMSFANEQGRQGNMDYGVRGFMDGSLKQNTFYIRGGHAYNIGDIGNYLFGRGMAELGIQLSTTSIGAHVNNMVNGRRDKVPLYDFGPGTYGKPGLFDSQGDQRAIVRGFLSTPKGVQLYKNEMQGYPKSNPK